MNYENENPNTGKVVKVEGEVNILIGRTGTGKTTYIRKALEVIPLKKEIFDIDNEYRDFGTIPLKRTEKKSLEDFADEFKNKICSVWESVIVLSEAGIFITNNGNVDMAMRELLKGARKRGNFVFLDFHKLSEVNVNILTFANRIIIKKTQFETKAQINKFSHYPIIVESMRTVQNSSNEFSTVSINRKDLKIDFD